MGRYILWTVIVLAAILLISFIFRYPTTRSIKKEIKRLDDYFDSLYAIGESYKEPYDSQDCSPEEALDRFNQILEEQGEDSAFQYAFSHVHDKGCEGFYLAVCEHFIKLKTPDYSKAIEIANEGITAARMAGNDLTVILLTYDKAECLENLGRYDQARTCYSFVETHVDPDIIDENGDPIKEVCQKRIKSIIEIINNPTTSHESARSHLSSPVAEVEQEYIEIYKQYSEDGVVSERDRKMLQKFSERCGITAERARELEASCLMPKLTKDEQEYLEMYKEYAADGEISDRDRKMLDKMRDKMGIGEERAREIEKL